ncbi:uncharacterized protein LOC134957864 [Pseudophryne corroboree]|uniref:uncharacterized protein LOC134957864 n=1 Tax=Pseudophryne corroboree TaxID=495146 RepID=UPI003081EAA4
MLKKKKKRTAGEAVLRKVPFNAGATPGRRRGSRTNATATGEVRTSAEAGAADDAVPGPSSTGELNIPLHVSTCSSSSSSSVSSGSPRRPRKLARLIARRMAKEAHKASAPAPVVSPDPPRYGEMVHCANTAVTRGVRKRMREKIRKGKYVDIFTLTEEMRQGFDAAKKPGGIGENAFRNFHQWLRGFLVFTACYTESRPSEYANLVKYLFLVHDMYLKSKGSAWRDYDEKFRRNQDGNPILPAGFKDVEVWLEVTQQVKPTPDDTAKKPGATGAAGSRLTGKGRCFAYNDGKLSFSPLM